MATDLSRSGFATHCARLGNISSGFTTHCLCFGSDSLFFAEEAGDFSFDLFEGAFLNAVTVKVAH